MSTDAQGCAHAGAAGRPRNRAGLAEIAYGAGTQPEHFAAMVAALAREPALSGLRTRALDDPSISLIDAWATVLDILSFYSARVANEGYLRTATERRSVQELARAIGYELNPGVAASTWLAFTVSRTPGAAETITLPAGLKVQSVPGAGEQPQTFETAAALDAHPELNALRPRPTAPRIPGRGATSVWLAGASTGLAPGDMLLFVGRHRIENPNSERWDARRVREVRADPAAGLTEVRWDEELGHFQPSVDPDDAPEVHAFRLRGRLFGHNAPIFRLLPLTVRQELRGRTEWPDFESPGGPERRIDLDGDHPEVQRGAWVMLDRPGYRELYRVERAVADARADYALTGATVRLHLDSGLRLSWFGLRDTTVFTASERLTRAEAPVAEPVFGDRVELGADHPALAPGRPLIVTGRPLVAVEVASRRRLFREGRDVVEAERPPLALAPEDGGPAQTLGAGERLSVLGVERPETGPPRWRLVRADGTAGVVAAEAGADLLPLAPEPAEAAFAPPDPALYASEKVLVREISRAEGRAAPVFETPLRGVYWRPSVTINANVALATHGETRTEITSALTGGSFTETLGDGDASRGMQTFRLSQAALTHVPAATASGAASTLVVRIDGAAWTEAATLYGQPPDARVFSTRLGPDGRVLVQFGDGRFGARLPTGRGNVTATYRVGIGLAGQVRAGQLTLPMTQPLGLRSVTNPVPAAGAQDPEPLEAARANAPLTVQTLDRIVSGRDFEDFARAFAGIGKAQATTLWSGERRLIHLTVAGADGSTLDPEGVAMSNLRAAIDGARHADRPIIVAPHAERRFGVRLAVAIEPALEAQPVLDAVRAGLEARYSFAGQPFAASVEASALVAGVETAPGVAAVVLRDLDGMPPGAVVRLPARRARWDEAGGAVLPAELLLVDPARIVLEVLAP